MKLKLISALAAGLLCAAPAFSATLDFQGAGDYNFIGDYYNGGFNDAGASGINYGISFGPDAFVLNNGDFEYYLNAPNAGVLTVVSPVDATDPSIVLPANAALNVAAGFSGLVSFQYSSVADTSVTVFSGLNGTGTALGTFNLFANNGACTDIALCQWNLASLDLNGVVAQSIQFGSTAGVAALDSVSINPVPLPAAAWLMVSALGGLGAMRRKQSA